ncbi:MAG: hypothetical protein LAN64_01770 [Acidobacteriia bacterium]|nr:hypothetical protein [Terriglobia bacterium]
MSTPNLGISHIAASQTSKEVTANAAFDTLDTALTDQLGINCAGSADVTPASTVVNGMVLQLTGLLTGNINLKLPAVKRPYFVRNQTTGTYTITVKTTAGGSTGVIIPQGTVMAIYSDGTNVVQFTPVVETDFVVKTIKFTLSSADILAIGTTPKLIVPAVSGKILTPLGGAAYYRAGATPYTIGAGAFFVFGPSTASGTVNIGYFPADGFITQATNQNSVVNGSSGFGVMGDGTGVGLYVGLSAVATLGNGTVDVLLHYSEATF